MGQYQRTFKQVCLDRSLMPSPANDRLSLSTPNLEVLGAPEGADPRGMEVQANYTDLSGVYLSSLARLYGELLLDGHIAGYSEPNSHSGLGACLLTPFLVSQDQPQRHAADKRHDHYSGDVASGDIFRPPGCGDYKSFR